MNYYRDSVIFFGLVIPAILVLAVVGAAWSLRSKMEGTIAEKISAFNGFNKTREETQKVESEVTRQLPNLQRWKASLGEETASAVRENLREIYSSLPSKEIQETAFDKPNGPGVFGTASAQKSSQVRIALRGTYRTLQRAFLELETRMPQLQLEELRIDPASNNASQVNFQVNYTAWEL